MIAEAAEARRREAGSARAMDVAVPLSMIGAKPAPDKLTVDDRGNVTFTLFTRRGNKPQSRTLAVPVNTALAAQTRATVEADLAEKEALKMRVLDYERATELASARTSLSSLR